MLAMRNFNLISFQSWPYMYLYHLGGFLLAKILFSKFGDQMHCNDITNLKIIII